MIGVFDSGLGGLSILKKLADSFPGEDFLYLGDTARLPYGTKSPRTIRNYLEQNINFLLTKNVKAIVVACNSASSVLTEADQFSIPVYNVITPGALAAAQTTKNNCIGVIGTRSTIAMKAYPKALGKISSNFKVYQQAAPLLVPLVEEGLVNDPISNLIIYRYLTPLLGQGIDCLILGCTHYPALKSSIQKVTGTNIQLVDSADALCQQMLDDYGERFSKSTKKFGEIHILTTDLNETYTLLVQQMLSPIAYDQIEQVDLNF